MVAAREFVFDSENKEGEPERRSVYTKHNLKREDGTPFCVECQTVFWGCSRKKLYPDTGRFGYKTRESTKDVCVMAWFRAQLFCLDVDPEDGTLTMPAARKKRVFEWYVEDVEQWPDCYVLCTERWFVYVWTDHFPHVKCRKWLRFAKCVECVELRTRVGCRSDSQKLRREAADKLREHYRLMKMERAYHRE
jgi:hypothetical protein